MTARFVIHHGKIEGIKLLWNRKTLDVDQIESYEDHLIHTVNEKVHVKETFNEITALIEEAEKKSDYCR